MRYSADITAGSLKPRESRVVAALLMNKVDDATWRHKIQVENVLQARTSATAVRIGRLLRLRLETMDAGLWQMVADGAAPLATQACFAAAIKHSPLLGDFLDLVLREKYRLFGERLTKLDWENYILECF